MWKWYWTTWCKFSTQSVGCLQNLHHLVQHLLRAPSAVFLLYIPHLLMQYGLQIRKGQLVLVLLHFPVITALAMHHPTLVLQ